jgi:hypothetical protein
VRTLTDAEAKVIAVLLGAATAPERERLRISGLPRSTYHAARRRAYLEHWLRDRYVPEPERFGLPWATFVVARPFADRSQELAREWSSQAGNVVLLSGPNAAVGAFLHPSQEAAQAFSGSGAWRGSVSSANVMLVDLRGPSVPVYFDFEGLWAHLSGIEGTVAYPRGLGGSGGSPDEPAPRPTDHQMWAAGELVKRPFASVDGAPEGQLVGPLGLPFSQRRLVAQGWVNHRVFLDPSMLSSYRGNQADQYVFISGQWKPEARPEALFQLLVRECRVFPFLYVVGHGRTLLGAMGSTGAPPATPDGTPRRRPVMPTLQSAISGIELVQEPARSLAVQVDHRYERLFPAKGAR